MDKKIIILVTLIIFASINFTLASEDIEQVIVQAEKIIQQRIPCTELTLEQLEIMGDYYMEQMHPGELHAIMDERMGGEGSEILKQIHINMGRTFYCGERGAISAGMMNMMVGRNGQYGQMMGSYYNSTAPNINYWFFVIMLLLAILIIIIILLILKLNERQKVRKKDKNG